MGIVGFRDVENKGSSIFEFNYKMMLKGFALNVLSIYETTASYYFLSPFDYAEFDY